MMEINSTIIQLKNVNAQQISHTLQVINVLIVSNPFSGMKILKSVKSVKMDIFIILQNKSVSHAHWKIQSKLMDNVLLAQKDLIMMNLSKFV